MLLFGIGNSGRQDDGLGWAFLDRIQQETSFGDRVEYRYQMQVEDAALISEADHVIFIDSCCEELPNGFQMTRCEPSREHAYTTHVLPPSAVLALCHDLYGKSPRADVLMIQGENWDLQIGISPQAKIRLDRAVAFFRAHLLEFAPHVRACSSVG